MRQLDRADARPSSIRRATDLSRVSRLLVAQDHSIETVQLLLGHAKLFDSERSVIKASKLEEAGLQYSIFLALHFWVMLVHIKHI